ncbi:MAG: DUF4101 domain-containing protein [Kamptonema sp. SIO1D9]|nr:DUF4101 domain-containing protein [Kamptonema sp. SIO1D9]
MGLRLAGLIVSIGIGVLAATPTQAQVTNTQINALVEALRRAVPRTPNTDNGLYSDWQVKPGIIPRWSKQCLQRELTPEQFAASPDTARTVVSCVVEDILEQQYQATGNDETLAVRRAAGWWMTGDANLYNNSLISGYTEKVLNLYQQAIASSTPPPTTATANSSPSEGSNNANASNTTAVTENDSLANNTTPEVVTSSARETNTAENTTATNSTPVARETNSRPSTTPEIVTSSASETNSEENTNPTPVARETNSRPSTTPEIVTSSASETNSEENTNPTPVARETNSRPSTTPEIVTPSASETNSEENTNPTPVARETNSRPETTPEIVTPSASETNSEENTNPTPVARETNSRPSTTPEIATSSATETNSEENTNPTPVARETNSRPETTPEIVTSSASETNSEENTNPTPVARETNRVAESTTTRNTAAVNTTPATPTPSLTPTRRPSLDGNTLYDRYMIAAYDASDQRNYQIALLYFQRALDERPGDNFAQQGVNNIRGNLGATSNSNSSSSFSRQITQQQALSLVSRWTQAKSQIFAPPFEARLISDLTTGELYDSLTDANGAIAWLRNNQAYYRFGVQKIESVERFVASETKATIEVKVTEDRTLYREGEIDPSQTEFDTQVIRYSLELVGNVWKIADYKTVDGSVLERGVLNTASRERE